MMLLLLLLLCFFFFFASDANFDNADVRGTAPLLQPLTL